MDYDYELQKTLRLAHHEQLIDVLSTVLGYEAASHASSGYSKIARREKLPRPIGLHDEEP